MALFVLEEKKMTLEQEFKQWLTEEGKALKTIESYVGDPN
jgi:hypothetical protein